MPDRNDNEPVEITEKGRAVVESGLTLRQAHEIETGCSASNLCDRCRRDLGMEDDHGNRHAYEAAVAERDSYIELSQQLLASMRTHIEIMDKQRARIAELEAQTNA